MPILDLIDEATLTYANSPTTGPGSPAPSSIAGWLGSRLNWRTPGELLPVRGDPNVWRATLRAGAAGKQREVTLTLRPTTRPLAASTLLDVRLAADGGQAGFFTVERLDDDEISTTSDSPEMPNMVRTVFAPLPTEADLLGEELRDFGRDPIFEAALAFAADMAPEGFMGRDHGERDESEVGRRKSEETSLAGHDARVAHDRRLPRSRGRAPARCAGRRAVR